MTHDISNMPERIARLPRDHRGFPIPFFVHYENGVPDFRVIGEGKRGECFNKKLCWLCGDKLGVYKAFVIGPMCVVNGVSSEPPSHLECAQYAVRACPFLANPRMRRNEKDMPETAHEADGIMIKRNPGVTAIWVTKKYGLQPLHEGGYLFYIGQCHETHWYKEGRSATVDEIKEAIRGGLPALQALAEQDGPESCKALQEGLQQVERSLPHE